MDEVAKAAREFRNCFNRKEFYEAHDVLEVIWLPRRRTTEGELWKGIIQLAAAFVHVQKGRKGPALSLLRSALPRLRGATCPGESLDVPAAIMMGEAWEARVTDCPAEGLAQILQADPPQIGLRSGVRE